MKPSPLDLERYFFAKVQLEANTEGDPKAENQIQCQVQVGQATGEPMRYQVSLTLKLQAEDGGTPCYTGEFHAVGFFKVSERWPEKQRLQLVETNGAALLYGSLRELVITLTARGPWPPVTLRSVTFLRPDESAPAAPKPASPARRSLAARRK